MSFDPLRLMSARSGHVTPSNDPAISPREFLERALKAIKRRRGLIHGTWNDSGRVCALGAFGGCNDGVTIPGELATQLQEFNDSMPRATPVTRRKRVIAWIERRLKELDCAS